MQLNFNVFVTYKAGESWKWLRRIYLETVPRFMRYHFETNIYVTRDGYCDSYEIRQLPKVKVPNSVDTNFAHQLCTVVQPRTILLTFARETLFRNNNSQSERKCSFLLALTKFHITLPGARSPLPIPFRSGDVTGTNIFSTQGLNLNRIRSA